MRENKPDKSKLVSFEIRPRYAEVLSYGNRIEDNDNGAAASNLSRIVLKTDNGGVVVTSSHMRGTIAFLLNELDAKFGLEIASIEEIWEPQPSNVWLPPKLESNLLLKLNFALKLASIWESLFAHSNPLRDEVERLDRAFLDLKGMTAEIKTYGRYKFIQERKEIKSLVGIRVFARTAAPNLVPPDLKTFKHDESECLYHCRFCGTEVRRPEDKCSWCGSKIGWISGGGFMIECW